MPAHVLVRAPSSSLGCRLAAASLLYGIACTPEVPPAWLIERPTELALTMAITEQGPFGERMTDTTRTWSEALPGDTLSFTPLVADADGPLSPEELDLHWILCDNRQCIPALYGADELDACDDRSYLEIEQCSLGRGGSAAYPMGLVTVPPDVDIDDVSLAALSFGPLVGFIGSRVGEPGSSACQASLRDRTRMDGCVMMLRTIRIGPFSALIDAAAVAGIEIEITESLEPLLARPRNRNPTVTQFFVQGSSRVAGHELVADDQSTVPVRRGDALSITQLVGPDDFDDYEAMVNGQLVSVHERLFATWFGDHDSARFESGRYEFDLDSFTLEWTVEGPAGPAHVYFVVRDQGGSEAWGWLRFDVSEG